MPKKAKSKPIICKNCGESWMPNEVPTNKEWTKIAPMPDSEGRITVMVMATWSCPNCGKSRMGLKGKYKDDGTSRPSKKEQILNIIKETDQRIAISEIADEISFTDENVEKALEVFIKRKTIKGKIEEGFFIKE